MTALTLLKMKTITKFSQSCGLLLQSIMVFSLLLVLFPSIASASVDNVTTSAPIVISANKTSNVINVTWNVTVTSPARIPFSVSSSSATLVINGVSVRTLNGNLTQTITLPIGQQRTLVFNDSFVLTLQDAQQILKSSAGSVSVTRNFSDGTNTLASNIPVAIGSDGTLQIRRVDLSFENSSRTDVVRLGERLRAYVDIGFYNNGLLRGEWRIVTPSSSMGSSDGRILQRVQQQLVSSGNGQTRIYSPPLPTDANGLYLLTFSVAETNSQIDTPILRYFVLEGGDEIPGQEISAISPGNGSVIYRDTVFSWQPLVNIEAYQVEVFKAGQAELITAKIVPGNQNKLTLSELSFEDLKPNTNYQWQVSAFNHGKVIARSQRFRMTMP